MCSHANGDAKSVSRMLTFDFTYETQNDCSKVSNQNQIVDFMEQKKNWMKIGATANQLRKVQRK